MNKTSKKKTGTLVKKKQPSELDALFKECKDKTPSSIPSQSLGYVTIIDDDILNLDEKCYEIDENENENENYNVDDDDDMNINPNDNEYPMVTIDNNVLAKYNSAQKARLKPNVFLHPIKNNHKDSLEIIKIFLKHEGNINIVD